MPRCPKCGWRIESGTVKQRGYYWAVVVHSIAVETGHDQDDIHNFLKGKFLPMKEVKIGGEVKTVGWSTERLSKEEKSIYLEQCIAFAEQNGIAIPPPPEKGKTRGL